MIEICCGSYEDALAAWRGGAKRIELNSALALGGLTPTAGSLRLVKRDTGLEVVCMVRPRGAGFCYSEAEKEQMFEEARELLEAGSDGLAFGFLNADGTVEEESTRRMAGLIHGYGAKAVFHRAFDCVKDPYAAAGLLIRLGVDRILTSGLREKAVQGKELLRELHRRFGGSVELLAGSGVNAQNAADLMAETGLDQVHSSCKGWREDPTTSGEYVNYRFAPAPHEDSYDAVDEELVRKLVKEAP